MPSLEPVENRLAQLELDLGGSIELREIGMARAAQSRQEMLEIARAVAE